MSALLKKLCMTVVWFASASAAAGVHLQPSLRLLAEQRYDDDIDAARADPGAATGLMMTKLSPQLGLEVADPTLTVDSWYSLDFTYRHGSDSPTSFDHRGFLSLEKRITERLRVDTDLRIWRVSDALSLPRMGVARNDDPVLYGRGELALAYQAARRWTIRPGYRFEGARVFGANSGAGFTHMPFLENWFRATPRSDLGLEYRWQYFQFDRAGREAAIHLDSAQSHSVAAAWRYRITRRINLSARAGPSFFARGGLGYTLVPRVQVDLHRDGEMMDLSLSAGHDVVGASNFSRAVWADYASVAAEWRFWRPLRLFTAASLFRNGQAPNRAWASMDVDAGYALGVGAEWQVVRNLSLALSLDRYSNFGVPDRDDAALLVDERNIASLKLNFRAF